MRNLCCLMLFVMTVVLTACGNHKGSGKEKTESNAWVVNDTSVYGLACEGCTDSVLVLLPSDCSDPVRYNIVEARRNNQVLGRPRIGDAMEIVLNKYDKRVADKVINMNELMGTWCYIVMPKMKDFETMSKSSQRQALLEMPDSVRQTFFIPREYGFSLKQQYTAGSIGYIREANSLEEESPVVYPHMALYTKWHLWNGKILLIRVQYDEKDVPTEIVDTCDIDYLQNDSLVLSSDGESRGYYRRANATDANKKAREIAEKQAKKALREALDK